MLLSGGWDGDVKLWDLASGPERAVLRTHRDGISALAPAPDGRTLVRASYDKAFKVWDAAPPVDPSHPSCESEH
jgi:WD40 repeat protein